jgi:excisionase family DNA binding protein
MNGLSDFDLLTLCEVAELLHCSKAHVSKVVAGRVPGCAPIPSVRLGRRKLVRRASLLTWIEHNEHAAANDNLRAVANGNLRASPERGRKSA